MHDVPSLNSGEFSVLLDSGKLKILDVIHPELANVSKDKLKTIISTKYKVDVRSFYFNYRCCFVWL